MTTARWIGALAAGAVLVAACSGGDDSAEETTTTAATTTSAPPVAESTTTLAESTTTTPAESTTTTTLPPVIRQPLTGRPLADEIEIVRRPALVVKIDNHPAARRNHSGLAVADIVFEEIVEGNITRFLAVFHSNGSDPLGPIRSGRSQDVALITSLDYPLFAWSGGNPGVTRLIADSPVVDLNAVRGGRGYYRGPGSAPHNLYSNTEALWQQTPDDHPGPPPQQFQYVRPEETFEGDEEVAVVNVDVGNIRVQWDWDAESGKWLRSQLGSPHVDVTHGPIAFTNVVVMSVPYGRSVIDATSPEAQTVGVGDVWVFSDGQLIQGEWARLTPEAPIEFYDPSGGRIALTPGNTWIELANRPAPIAWS